MTSCVFARRRFSQKAPTFTELFQNVTNYSILNRNNANVGAFSQSRPSNAIDGQTWFYIYCVGRSMQISRCEMVNTTEMTFKEVKAYVPSGATAYKVGLSADSTQVESITNIYACEGIFLRFGTYNADTIEYMFTNGIYNLIKYYYSTTITDASTADTSLRVTQSTFNNYTGGICFVAYRSNADSNNVWAAVDGHTPTTLIQGAYGSNWWTKSPIISSGSYYVPIRTNQTSNAAPYTRTLTWIHIKENW